MDKVPKAFIIYDIQSSPARDEKSSVCQFERVEMQMIRWMCGVSMKDRKTHVELRKLVGVEYITTVIRSGWLDEEMYGV